MRQLLDHLPTPMLLRSRERHEDKANWDDAKNARLAEANRRRARMISYELLRRAKK